MKKKILNLVISITFLVLSTQSCDTGTTKPCKSYCWSEGYMKKVKILIVKDQQACFDQMISNNMCPEGEVDVRCLCN